MQQPETTTRRTAMIFPPPLLSLPRMAINLLTALALFIFTRPGGWFAACVLILIGIKVFFPVFEPTR